MQERECELLNRKIIEYNRRAKDLNRRNEDLKRRKAAFKVFVCVPCVCVISLLLYSHPSFHSCCQLSILRCFFTPIATPVKPFLHSLG
jgi:hypothetical protein